MCFKEGRTKNLSEFVYEFFRNRFGNHNIAVEMGYNLDYASKRFKHNENCQLFYHILSGDVISILFFVLIKFNFSFRLMKIFIIIQKILLNNLLIV